MAFTNTSWGLDFEPSARDRELLYAYAMGKKDKEIAGLLAIRPSYVGTVGARMRQRMGAKDRAHAVSIAYQLGILTVGGEP